MMNALNECPNRLFMKVDRSNNSKAGEVILCTQCAIHTFQVDGKLLLCVYEKRLLRRKTKRIPILLGGVITTTLRAIKKAQNCFLLLFCSACMPRAMEEQFLVRFKGQHQNWSPEPKKRKAGICCCSQPLNKALLLLQRIPFLLVKCF